MKRYVLKNVRLLYKGPGSVRTRKPGGREIKAGAKVQTYRGESAELLAIKPPAQLHDAGRVVIRLDNGHEAQVFPGVIYAMIEADIVEEEDDSGAAPAEVEGPSYGMAQTRGQKVVVKGRRTKSQE